MKTTYSKYKPSGVEWIGDIPEHWEVKKLKYLSKVFNGSTPKDQTEYWEGNIHWITPTDIGKIKEEMYISTTSRKITEKGLNSCGCSLCPSYSVVITNRGPIGNVIIPQMDFSTNQGCKSLVLKNHNNIYLYYQLKTWSNVLESLGEGTTFKELSTSSLNNFCVSYPPLPEQEQIVKYLDEQTGEIDNLISITEKKIELLKENRTSTINRVITKGLDPNVELKDSGIEWIGEIPKHWKMNKVKRNTYVKGRIGWKGLKSEDFIDKGPFLITGTDFKTDGTINWDKMYHVCQERYDEDPYIQLKENDVLITKDGTIGKVVFVEKLKGQTCLNSGIFLTRPTGDEYMSKYFYHILISNVFKVFFEYNSGGSTILHLYQNVFDDFLFPIPPKQEQSEIVKYIEQRTQEIDTLISIEQQRIETLKEYRQSLISEVITGKVRVCEEVKL
jgi:type I restriction enzyme, S subunit